MALTVTNLDSSLWVKIMRVARARIVRPAFLQLRR
jgi:hypothetical protein